MSDTEFDPSRAIPEDQYQASLGPVSIEDQTAPSTLNAVAPGLHPVPVDQPLQSAGVPSEFDPSRAVPEMEYKSNMARSLLKQHAAGEIDLPRNQLERAVELSKEGKGAWERTYDWAQPIASTLSNPFGIAKAAVGAGTYLAKLAAGVGEETGKELVGQNESLAEKYAGTGQVPSPVEAVTPLAKSAFNFNNKLGFGVASGLAKMIPVAGGVVSEADDLIRSSLGLGDNNKQLAGLYQFEHDMNQGIHATGQAVGIDDKSPTVEAGELASMALIPGGAEKAAAPLIAKGADAAVELGTKVAGGVLKGAAVTAEKVGPAALATAEVTHGHPWAALGTLLAGYTDFSYFGKVKHLIMDKGIGGIKVFSDAMMDTPGGKNLMEFVQDGLYSDARNIDAKVADQLSKTKPEDLADIAKVNPDGTPMYTVDSPELSPQAKKVLNLQNQAASTKQSAAAMSKYVAANQILSDTTKYALRTVGNLGVAGTTGAAFTSAAAAPEDREAEQQGLNLGIGLGLLGVRGANREGVLAMNKSRLLKDYALPKDHILASEHSANMAEMPKSTQGYINTFSALSEKNGGKHIIVLKPDEMVDALKEHEGVDVVKAPNGFDGKNATYVNADTLTSGVVPHEVIHGTGIDSDPELVQAIAEMQSDPEHQPQLQKAIDKYNTDLQTNQPGAELSIHSTPKEIAAALGADMLTTLPPEAIYGGRSGGAIIKKWITEKFGSKENSTTTQYGFPVTPKMKSAMEDALYAAGKTAEQGVAPKAPVKPEDVKQEEPAVAAPASTEINKEIRDQAVAAMKALNIVDPVAKVKSVMQELGPNATLEEVVRKSTQRAVPKPVAEGLSKISPVMDESGIFGLLSEEAQGKLDTVTQALQAAGVPKFESDPHAERVLAAMGGSATPEEIVAQVLKERAGQRNIPKQEMAAQPSKKDLSDVSLMPASKSDTIDRPASKISDLIFPGTPRQAKVAAKKYGLSDVEIQSTHQPGFVTVGGAWKTPEEARLLGEETKQLPESTKDKLTPEDLAGERLFMPSSHPDAIDSAAIRTPDGKIWKGLIHADAEEKMMRHYLKYGNQDILKSWIAGQKFDLGYTTKKDRFLDTQAALEHADNIGQVSKAEHGSALDAAHLENIKGDMGLEAGAFHDTRRFMPSPSDHPDALDVPAIKRKSDGKVYKAKDAATPHWQMALQNPELKDRYTSGGVDRYVDGWVTNPDKNGNREFLDKEQGHKRAIEQKQISPNFKTEYKGALSSLDMREGGQFMPSVERAQQSAEDYVNKSGIGKIIPSPTARVDVGRARQIAKDYEALPKSDSSPETKASYEQFVKEVNTQYRHALDSGMKFEFTKEDPYKSSADMMADVEKNGRLKVYTGGDDHPYLGSSTKDENGLTANDKFRAVHDLYGHASIGAQFGPQGEERAWMKHAAMFSDEARPAMTAETRGQNSWVNYGPHMFDENGWKGDKSHPDYIPPTERPFAEQKASLLPKEHSKPPDQTPEGPANAPGSRISRPDLSGVTMQPETTKLDSETFLGTSPLTKAELNPDRFDIFHDWMSKRLNKGAKTGQKIPDSSAPPLKERLSKLDDPFKGKTIEAGEEPWSIRLKELADKEWNGGKLTDAEEKEFTELHKQAAKEYGSYQNWFEKMGGEKDYLGRVFGEAAQKNVQFMPSDDKDAIKEAAIRLKDGTIYTGATHGEAGNEIYGDRRERELPDSMNGFVTNSGEFLDRGEAYQRAIKLRQISKAQYDKYISNYMGSTRPSELRSNLDAVALEDNKRFMPAPHIDREAERLGLAYKGDMGEGNRTVHLYNDPVTRSTIAIKQDAERGELQKKLADTRDRFKNAQFMPGDTEDYRSYIIKTPLYEHNSGFGKVYISSNRPYDFKKDYRGQKPNQFTLSNPNQTNAEFLNPLLAYEGNTGLIDNRAPDLIRQAKEEGRDGVVVLNAGAVYHNPEWDRTGVPSRVMDATKTEASAIQFAKDHPDEIDWENPRNIFIPIDKEAIGKVPDVAAKEQSIPEKPKWQQDQENWNKWLQGEGPNPFAEDRADENPPNDSNKADWWKTGEEPPQFMPSTDQWSKIQQHLTPEERASIRERDTQKIVDVFNKLPSIKKGMEAALAGQDQRHWYRNSAEAISNTFGPDADRFAALLAALSPQVSVETNLQNAVSVWNRWLKDGRPTDKENVASIISDSLKAGDKDISPSTWINNSHRALSNDDPTSIKLSGPKVDSFFQNLRNSVTEVTNDRWMGQYGFGSLDAMTKGRRKSGDIEGKGLNYLALNAHIRKVAKALTQRTGENWEPSEVQAALWSYQKAKSDGTAVADVPEFSKLLRDMKPLDKLEPVNESPF